MMLNRHIHVCNSSAGCPETACIDVHPFVILPHSTPVDFTHDVRVLNE